MTTSPELLPLLLRSPADLQREFADGLAGIVDADVLGVFILVLANACYDAEMYERLAKPLRVAYQGWCDRFDRSDPLALNAAADDVEVFLRVRALGFEALPLTAWREVGPWRLQFNALRALRPPRNSHARVDSLQRPFDDAGFHFNKPFLRREILWEGPLLGPPMRLLYNKFPFANLHGLLVPEPTACHAQFLSRKAHRMAWDAAQLLACMLPGIGLGYNAIGALASVNQLHFQLFVDSSGGYPIESDRWRHNGGQIDYPLPVARIDNVDDAWGMIESLHAHTQAYNLVYRPGRVFIVPRALQGGYQHSSWTGGFAWSEIAGVITLFDADAFAALDEEMIDAEFQRIAAPGGSAMLRP